MLVLSRKPGEDVLIGNDIAVSIVAIQGKRVKLAFTAPNDVVIRRAELVVVNDDSIYLAAVPAGTATRPR